MSIPLGLLPLLLGLVVPSVTQFQCPEVCRCDPAVLNCSYGGLRQFPQAIDPQVNIVDVSHNSIRWLPVNLGQYGELREIHLRDNRIDNLYSTTFQGLRNLTLIDLSENTIRNLKRIEANTFLDETPGILTLNLSGNRIELLSYDSANIIKSASLETLDMSRCGLYDISDLRFLSGLKKIKYLYLAENNLMWISGLISDTLLHLDVSKCKLDSIHPGALTGLPALESLDVSKNENFAFSGGTYSKSLKILKARSCNIKMSSLKFFPNLTHVDLRDNTIAIIHNNTFNNSQLIEMDLAGNSIGSSEIYPFTNLPKLERLNLAMNGIKYLAWNTFSSDVNLKVLNLSSNALQILAKFSIPSLKTLDVSHCSVSKLPDSFLTGLTSLQYLNLSDNNIENAPNAMNSTVLLELNLSFNRLSALANTTFAGLRQLRVLDLRGNRFTTPFRAAIFLHNTKLRIITLTDNPWICNCEDEEFHLLYRFLGVRKVENAIHLLCSSPDSLRGMKWQQACHDVWYPKVTESSMIQRYGVISTVVILCVGGAMIIISAVRRGFKERKLERRRREEEESRERALEIHEMMIRRQLENMSRESSPEMRPGSRLPRRTPSQITQPPTYEEALLMSRSQRDLLERGTLYDNTTQTEPHKPEVSEGLQRTSDHSDSDNVSDSGSYSPRL